MTYFACYASEGSSKPIEFWILRAGMFAVMRTKKARKGMQFCWRLDSRDANGATIKLVLAASPKADMDGWLGAMASLAVRSEVVSTPRDKTSREPEPEPELEPELEPGEHHATVAHHSAFIRSACEAFGAAVVEEDEAFVSACEPFDTALVETSALSKGIEDSLVAIACDGELYLCVCLQARLASLHAEADAAIAFVERCEATLAQSKKPEAPPVWTFEEAVEAVAAANSVATVSQELAEQAVAKANTALKRVQIRISMTEKELQRALRGSASLAEACGVDVKSRKPAAFSGAAFESVLSKAEDTAAQTAAAERTSSTIADRKLLSDCLRKYVQKNALDTNDSFAARADRIINDNQKNLSQPLSVLMELERKGIIDDSDELLNVAKSLFANSASKEEIQRAIAASEGQVAIRDIILHGSSAFEEMMKHGESAQLKSKAASIGEGLKGFVTAEALEEAARVREALGPESEDVDWESNPINELQRSPQFQMAVKGVVLKYIVETVRGLKLPPIYGSKDWGEYGIKGLRVEAIDIPNAEIELQESARIALTDIELTMSSFTWNYLREAFPRMQDTGSAAAQVRGLFVQLEFNIVNDGTGLTIADVVSEVSVGGLLVSVSNSKHTWLYNKLLKVFSEQVSSVVVKELQSKIDESVLSLRDKFAELAKTFLA